MENAYSSPREIREELTLQVPGVTPGGVILHREGGDNYCYTGESHTLLIGETGTGKSSSGVSPLVWSCIQAGESIIMVEPKDEHARHFKQMLERGGYRTAKINFSNPSDPESIGCNLLAYPRHCHLSQDPILRNAGEDSIDSLSAGIWPVSPQVADPFWCLESRNMFRGAAQLLFDYASEDETTFTSIHNIFAQDDGLSRSGLRKVAATLPKDSHISRMLAGYLQAPGVTRGGLQASFLSRLLPYTRETFLSLLGRDELHIAGIQADTPIAVFIILPDQSDHCDPLAGALVTQLISHYYYLAQANHGGRLPRRVNVILEELGNIGLAIPQLHRYMSGARSRNIRLHLVLQDRSQLDCVYGTGTASTILQNAGLVLQFRSNHWPTLQELSQRMGLRQVMICGRSFTLPVITENQLAALRTGEALVNLQGRLKFVARLPHISILTQSLCASPPCEGVKLREPPSLFDIDALSKKMEKGPVATNRMPAEEQNPQPGKAETARAPLARFKQRKTASDALAAEGEAADVPAASKPARNIPLPPRSEHSLITFDATLMEIGEKRAELTFQIHQLTGIPCDTLIRGMRKLPYRVLSGVPRIRAQALQTLVQQLGGICAVTKTGDPEVAWIFE